MAGELPSLVSCCFERRNTCEARLREAETGGPPILLNYTVFVHHFRGRERGRMNSSKID